MRVFCFPHAGAGALQFRCWRMPGLDAVPIPLPGRENRFSELPHRHWDTLLRDIISFIEPRLDTPFAFFGHSMGALVAFETARELRRRRSPLPDRIFVSSFRAPHLPDRNLRLHGLPDNLLKSELARLNGMPTEILSRPELVDPLLATLRADMEIVEIYKYKAEPPLHCGLTCFGGLTDSRVSRLELAGWRQHARGNFRLHMFPGGHFYLYKMPVLVQRAICADLGLPVPCSNPTS